MTYRFWKEILDLKYVENSLELIKADLKSFEPECRVRVSLNT